MNSMNVEDIKVIMITPDPDNEISVIKNKLGRPTKSRIVLECELDGVYIAKSSEEIILSDKIKSLDALTIDLENIIKDAIDE